MSADELAQARREIGRLRLPIMQVPTRRFRRRPARPRGSTCGARCASRCAAAGPRSTSRARSGRERHPPLVILCDISGSMSRYSRMLLLFMHAITNDRDRVHSFLFGTRLTNVTRHLRNRDIDLALAADRRRWCRTGPAARGSAPASRSSTGSGRAACWARGRWCS